MVSKFVIAVCIMAIIVGPSIVPVAEAGLLGKVWDKLGEITCVGCEWTKDCYDPNSNAGETCNAALAYTGLYCGSWENRSKSCENGGVRFLCKCQ